jgi:hypothetical protein
VMQHDREEEKVDSHQRTTTPDDDLPDLSTLLSVEPLASPQAGHLLPSFADVAVSGDIGRRTSLQQLGAASTGGPSQPVSIRSSVLETPSGEEIFSDLFWRLSV